MTTDFWAKYFKEKFARGAEADMMEFKNIKYCQMVDNRTIEEIKDAAFAPLQSSFRVVADLQKRLGIAVDALDAITEYSLCKASKAAAKEALTLIGKEEK